MVKESLTHNQGLFGAGAYITAYTGSKKHKIKNTKVSLEESILNFKQDDMYCIKS
jgi:hypothetical protein